MTMLLAPPVLASVSAPSVLSPAPVLASLPVAVGASLAPVVGAAVALASVVESAAPVEPADWEPPGSEAQAMSRLRIEARASLRIAAL